MTDEIAHQAFDDIKINPHCFHSYSNNRYSIKDFR